MFYYKIFLHWLLSVTAAVRLCVYLGKILFEKCTVFFSVIVVTYFQYYTAFAGVSEHI